MKINCVIVDDEPFARKGLSGYVEKISYLSLTAVCSSAFELDEVLKTHEVDLIFLDIEMPQLTGLAFLKTLKYPPLVILTTAYQQYALESYDYSVLDYLLKPIPFERFYQAAQKAWQALEKAKADEEPYFFIKTDQKIEKLFVSEVLFAEAQQNYLSVYTENGVKTFHYTLKAFQEDVKAFSFLKTHQSYLVNTRKVDAIDGNQLQIGKYMVPISKQLRNEVLEILLQDRFLRKR